MSVNARFHKLRIAEVRRETQDSASIRFEIPPELKETFAFKAGQHLTLRAEIDGEDLRRTYSVCAAPHEGEIRIAVKRMQGGRFSTWANDLQAGCLVDVLPPLGKFTPPAAARAEPYYVALAGGSGVTPVISILKSVLKENPRARFAFLYGNRDSASIMFLEELAGLKDRYLDRLEVYHFLENESGDIELFNGRLDRAKCDAAFSTLIDAREADAIFICGPGPMMDAAEQALLARGVPPERILIERFTTGAVSAERQARDQALQRKAEGARIWVTLDGRKAQIPFDAGKGNILESVQAAGMPAPYACKGGVCSTCRAKLISGTVAMKQNYGLTEAELAAGFILTCQSVPTSDEVVITYDA
ncbi:MAG TPA: 1,2-phenylacetyl-CoA epoxidase subunit PaaE [Rhizomicrobium sp.]|jgi:ring-1,2-phenylacetyl-CoA epoxidase subunit PaaE|nr:1,2-phenylacetyl-CoA epoxidase subunit PaaE [Rhizomicrobium sp.]